MLPEMTAEERRAASARAAEARSARASLRRAIKARAVDPRAALADPAARRMRVRLFLTALPGVGRARAERAMAGLRISPGRRVGGLGPRQMERLTDWIDSHEH